jgi:peptide/nickel transport system permease protein
MSFDSKSEKIRVIGTSSVASIYRKLKSDKMLAVYVSYILFVGFLGVFGQELTPYEYEQLLLSDTGILRTASPSLSHPLGTTDGGYDVISRLMYGARPTVVTGLLGGTIIITIGATIGIVSGYYEGRIGNLLMRFTDFMFSVPIIPFAIVLMAILGRGFFIAILVIGLTLWRSSARVIRSQVLQIKEREFILAARATGASDFRIIFKHILPNIAPMAALLLSLGIGYAIIAQASLAFIGVVDPFVPSWGVMLRNAYNSGSMATAPWWSLPPGILISLTVLSTFMIGRKLANQQSAEEMKGATNG